jgi:RNA polymerase sigma factor (sigma-70 family)
MREKDTQELDSLVRKARGGDMDAFGAVVGRFQDMAVGYAYSILGDFGMAEDAAQEAFVQAYRSLAALRSPEAFAGWFRKVVRSNCLNLRRNKRLPSLSLDHASDVASGDPSPAQRAQAREMGEKVLAAVRALPEKEREATTLFYIDGYSLREVAEFLEVPVPTVKNRLHSSRKRLKERMTTMMATGLKTSRPGKRFAKDVARRIRQVRVVVNDPGIGAVLLENSQGHALAITMFGRDARVLDSWISGCRAENAPDVYAALVRALELFGYPVKEVVLHGLPTDPHKDPPPPRASVYLEGAKASTPIQCSRSRGVDLALRAKAPIYVDQALASQALLRGKNGKPMSLRTAWREIRRPGSDLSIVQVRFKSVRGILRAIEKDPENKDARHALGDLSWGSDTHIDKPASGIAALEDWARRKAGTPREGLAVGLLGAVYLQCEGIVRYQKERVKGGLSTEEQAKSLPSVARFPEVGQALGEAIPLLEKAHRLRPKDRRVAFDLWTALKLAGRDDEAGALEKKEHLTEEGFLALLRKLWTAPRFLSTVHVNAVPDNLLVAQIGASIDLRVRASFAKWSKYLHKGSQLYLRPPGFKVPKLGRRRKQQLEEEMGRGPLVAVEGGMRIRPNSKKAHWDSIERILLTLEGGLRVRLTLDPMGAYLIMCVFLMRGMGFPFAAQMAAETLAGVGIRVQAAVLLKRQRGGIEGALVLSKGPRRETIPMAGAVAMAIALASKSPVLIAKSLARALPRHVE